MADTALVTSINWNETQEQETELRFQFSYKQRGEKNIYLVQLYKSEELSNTYPYFCLLFFITI